MANPKKSDRQNLMRLIGYGAVLLFLAVAFNSLWNPDQAQKTVPYSQFQTWLSKGQVSDLTVGQTSISGTYKPPKGQAQKFTTDRVDPAIAEQLNRHNVSYAGEPPPG